MSVLDQANIRLERATISLEKRKTARDNAIEKLEALRDKIEEALQQEVSEFSVEVAREELELAPFRGPFALEEQRARLLKQKAEAEVRVAEAEVEVVKSQLKVAPEEQRARLLKQKAEAEEDLGKARTYLASLSG